MSNEQTATASVDQAEENTNQAVTPEVEAEKQPDPAQEVKEAKQEKSPEQRRIDRLTRDKHQLRGELQAIRQQIESMRPAEKQDDDSPDIETLVERKLAEREAMSRAKSVESKSIDIFYDAIEKAGIDEKNFIPLPEALADGVLESDMAADVVAYLQKNPDEIERISELSEKRQLVELGKIEDKLSQKPALKKSSAPAPISPISGKKGGTLEYSPSMTDEEYDKWTEQQRKILKGR